MTGDDEIELRIPARAEFVRLARLTAADVGSRVGLAYEDVDDLRIAIDELCNAVIGEGPPRSSSDGAAGVLEICFSWHDGAVTIDGSCTNPRPPFLNELSAAILAAVVDEQELTGVDGVARFRMVKRPTR